MPKPSSMYCPNCRRVGIPDVELMTEAPEPHLFRCMNSHVFEREALMAAKPDMVKMVVREVPGPHDVKTEFWIHGEVLKRFQAKFPNQMSATVNSILQMYLTGDVLIIDGIQAKKLHELGARTGQEVIALLEGAKTTEAELATTKEQLQFLAGLMNRSGAEA